MIDSLSAAQAVSRSPIKDSGATQHPDAAALSSSGDGTSRSPNMTSRYGRDAWTARVTELFAISERDPIEAHAALIRLHDDSTAEPLERMQALTAAIEVEGPEAVAAVTAYCEQFVSSGRLKKGCNELLADPNLPDAPRAELHALIANISRQSPT